MQRDPIVHELRYSHLNPATHAHLNARIEQVNRARRLFKDVATRVRFETRGERLQPQTPCQVCGGEPFIVLGGRVLCSACADREVA